MTRIIYLVLLITLIGCSTDKKDNSEIIDIASSNSENDLKSFLGVYLCCPNENGRDEIQQLCDNLVPSQYTLSLENDQLIFSSLYVQDGVQDIAANYEISGDTLLFNFTFNNKSLQHKISPAHNFIYDARNDITANGWVKDPEANGWTIDYCDIGEEI